MYDLQYDIDIFLKDQMILTGSLNDKIVADDVYHEYVMWFNERVNVYKGDFLDCRDFLIHLRKYPELYFVTKFKTVCVGIKLKQD
jgi:hypothetical protein